MGLIPFPIVNNHKLKIDVAGGWFDTHLLRSGLVTDVCELVRNRELCTLTEQPLTALNHVCVLLALLKIHCPLGFRENRHLIDKTFSIFFRKPYGHPRSFFVFVLGEQLALQNCVLFDPPGELPLCINTN